MQLTIWSAAHESVKPAFLKLTVHPKMPAEKQEVKFV
jgi:hypothetical protein